MKLPKEKREKAEYSPYKLQKENLWSFNLNRLLIVKIHLLIGVLSFSTLLSHHWTLNIYRFLYISCAALS